MKRTLVTTVLLALASLLPAAAQLLTPEQLREDMARVQTALAEAHPDPYAFTPKATFDSLVEAVSAGFNQPMTRHDFYKAVIPVMVALRDGHIKWMVAGQDEHYPFDTTHLFPLRLFVTGERAWVLGSFGSETAPAGAEVMAINGQPMPDLIRQLLPRMTFADGYTNGGKYSDLNQFFSGFYATFIATPDEFEVSLQTDKGTEKRLLRPVRLSQIRQYEATHNPAPESPYRLTFADDSTTAVLTMTQFMYGPGVPDPKQFMASAFRQLRQRNICRLVLDLRDNEGGEEVLGVRLYSYLIGQRQRYYDRMTVRQKARLSFPAWMPKIYRIGRSLVVKKRPDGYRWVIHPGLKRIKPRRDAYTGQLVVLLNGRSFSTTTELAARLRSRPQTTFVGQETGGGFRSNNSGFFAVTRLPHSGLEFGVPLIGFHMAGVPQTSNGGIRPDHWVEPTITDMLTKTDPALQLARKLTLPRDTVSAASTQQ